MVAVPRLGVWLPPLSIGQADRERNLMQNPPRPDVFLSAGDLLQNRRKQRLEWVDAGESAGTTQGGHRRVPWWATLLSFVITDPRHI